MRRICTLIIVSMLFTATSAHAGGPGLPLAFSVSIPFDLASKQKTVEEANLGETSFCQSSIRPTSTKPSYFKEVVDILAASVIFAGLDYAFFRWLRPNPEGVKAYRPFQLGLQIGLSAALFYRNGGPKNWKEGLKVAGAFNMLWWTFNHDLLYYGIGEIAAPSEHDYAANVGAWQMRHAAWTPYGIGKTLFSGEKWGTVPYSEQEIWTQAIVGQLLAAGLLALDTWEESCSIPSQQQALGLLPIKLPSIPTITGGSSGVPSTFLAK